MTAAACESCSGKSLIAPETRECLEASRRLSAKVRGRAVFVGACTEHDRHGGVLGEDSPMKPATSYRGARIL